VRPTWADCHRLTANEQALAGVDDDKDIPPDLHGEVGMPLSFLLPPLLRTMRQWRRPLLVQQR
jgi:hypothetical protein